MDEKAREEIHNRMFFTYKSDYNRLEVDETIDLAEKAVLSDVKSAVKKVFPCLTPNTTTEGKFSCDTLKVWVINSWIPLSETNWCDNCLKRKEIFKEVGLE